MAHKAVLQLQNHGVDIIHCGDVGMADAEDLLHLVYASNENRVMVSCDDDFLRLHNQYQLEEREHAGIVYFRMVDQCKNIGLIVREILFLHTAAIYEEDLYNQVWRVKS